MISKIPEPDLEYLQKVLLEMLAIPSPTGFTEQAIIYLETALQKFPALELQRRLPLGETGEPVGDLEPLQGFVLQRAERPLADPVLAG